MTLSHIPFWWWPWVALVSGIGGATRRVMQAGLAVYRTWVPLLAYGEQLSCLVARIDLKVVFLGMVFHRLDSLFWSDHRY